LENAVDSNHSGKSDTPYRDALKLNTKTILKSVSEKAVAIKKSQELLQQSLNNADSDTRKVNTILFGLKKKTILTQMSEVLNKECFSNLCKPVSAYQLGAKKEGRI